ncbi:hypothetical protein TNCV_84371 [Trichonephila clavipes]|nr:hypothetical protein TNCV_84371 [Trichonephila clavipes]
MISRFSIGGPSTSIDRTAKKTSTGIFFRGCLLVRFTRKGYLTRTEKKKTAQFSVSPVVGSIEDAKPITLLAVD